MKIAVVDQQQQNTHSLSMAPFLYLSKFDCSLCHTLVVKNLEKDCIAVEKMGRSSDWIRILMFYRHAPGAQLVAGTNCDFPDAFSFRWINFQQIIIHNL
jgi:hypothetical protein